METNTSTQTPKVTINKGRPVYISYAGNSSTKPEWEHIADGVEDLKAALEAEGIEYCIRNLMMGDNLTDFERQIGEAEVVVLVFSDKYFRTEHCMYEFVEIKRSILKHPDKKLLCIKSGTFDLADVNYILDLEHFWGNESQKYKEREYHQMRQHTEQEKSANDNGFYIDDIRKLYSFFSSINYLNMAVVNWKDFVSDISEYYKQNPVGKANKKRRKMPTALKWFLSGLAVTFFLALIFTIILEFGKEQEFIVEYPNFKQNDYYKEGGVLKRISCTDSMTTLYFSFPNSYKDSMPFSGDKDSMILVERRYGRLHGKYHIVSVDKWQSTYRKRNSISGDNAASTDFVLTYPEVLRKNNAVFDFLDGDKGVYGFRIPTEHLVSVEHPEYERSTENCYIYKIDLDQNETKLYFRLVNDGNKDSVFYVLDEYYIYANGKKYELENSVGIPTYPNTVIKAKGALMNFALIFPPIPSTTEFIHFVGGKWKIYGLKVQRDNLYEVSLPKYENVDTTNNYKITKIEVNSGETVVHLRYFAKHGSKSQPRMLHNSYIIADHTKYPLKGSSGLPSTLDSTIKWLDFALIYPPIPDDYPRMDCILYEDYDTMDIIGFYGLELNPPIIKQKGRLRATRDSLSSKIINH